MAFTGNAKKVHGAETERKQSKAKDQHQRCFGSLFGKHQVSAGVDTAKPAEQDFSPKIAKAQQHSSRLTESAKLRLVPEPRKQKPAGK